MRFPTVFCAFALVCGAAGPAAAQSKQDVAYQTTLLARPLPAAEKTYCDGKAGSGNADEYAICRVTRLFIADIKADRDKGFPPLVDIKYADKAETDLILDRMTKYGG